MNDEDVLVRVEYSDDLDKVVEELKAVGFVVSNILSEIGIAVGKYNGDIAILKGIDGVHAVEYGEKAKAQ